MHRIAGPADALNRTGFATTLVDQRIPSPEVMKILRPDACVFQHSYTDTHLLAMKGLSQLKIPMIYEIDDLLWDIDDANVYKASFPADIKARIIKGAKLCDRVVAATSYLAVRIHKDLDIPTNKIVVVPNTLPHAYFTVAASVKERLPARPNNKPRVGWAGSGSHTIDLAILTPVVKATLNKYQWVFMGFVPPGIDTSEVEFHPAVPFANFAATLASLDLDLAVAPLADTEFNRCKSDLKVLEYGSCGFPVLASDVGPYARTEAPIEREIPNTTEGWLRDLDYLLVTNKDYREDQAQNLMDYVKANRLLESRESLTTWSSAWGSTTPETTFVPGVTAMSHATTAPLAIVGEPVDVPEAQYFLSFQDARRALPHSPILYVRPGALLRPEHVVSMIAVAAEDGRQPISVSTFCNDGGYPVRDRFSQYDMKQMMQMSDAALLSENPDIDLPYPNGPAVLLTMRGLALAGAPDDHQFADAENALIDWGARVGMLGGKHVLDSSSFVPVVASRQQGQDALRQDIARATLWHPLLEKINQHAEQVDLMAPIRRSLDIAMARLYYDAPLATSYPEWHEMHDTVSESAKEWAHNILSTRNDLPKISIIMPCYSTPPDMFNAAVKSVADQLYTNWELIIVDDASPVHKPVLADFSIHKKVQFVYRSENGHICKATNDGLAQANGDWVLFLDHDDTLSPFTLIMLALEATQEGARFVYADSDLIDANGELHSPDFKPGFDYDLLLAQNYVCHPALYRRDDLVALKGMQEGLEGSQDYDLTLRLIERIQSEGKPLREAMRHVPMVLYHWRQSPESVSTDIQNKPYAIEAARKAVLHHVTRSKRQVFLSAHPQAPLHHLVRFLPPDPAVSVAIVILTQFNSKVLESCLSTVLAKTGYPNFRVIVRQVGDEKDVSGVCTRYAANDKRVIYLKGSAGETFNFAAMNNAVVAKHCSDARVIVFLNDDTAVLESSWLHDMVGRALQPDAGAVGCKLMHADGTLQHIGILTDPTAAPGEAAIHPMWGQHYMSPGVAGRAVLARQWAAVTAACMAIEKKKFDAVGGFDGENFPVDYNDVDLCLRLEKQGLSNICLLHVTLLHHEGLAKRKNPVVVSRARILAAENRLRETMSTDIRSNPNLEHDHDGTHLLRCPSRPWRGVMPKALLVGADAADARALLSRDVLAFSAHVEGPLLQITEPASVQGSVIDLRDVNEVEEFLSGFGINSIILRSIGKGTTDIIGTFGLLKARGFDVTYSGRNHEPTCPRGDCMTPEGPCGHKWMDEPPFTNCQACVDKHGATAGPVCVLAYRNSWIRLANLLHLGRSAPPDPVDTTTVDTSDLENVA